MLARTLGVLALLLFVCWHHRCKGERRKPTACFVHTVRRTAPTRTVVLESVRGKIRTCVRRNRCRVEVVSSTCDSVAVMYVRVRCIHVNIGEFSVPVAP